MFLCLQQSLSTHAITFTPSFSKSLSQFTLYFTSLTTFQLSILHQSFSLPIIPYILLLSLLLYIIYFSRFLFAICYLLLAVSSRIRSSGKSVQQFPMSVFLRPDPEMGYAEAGYLR